MGPNDVEIIRVYTRKKGGLTADREFHHLEEFQIVIEAEAGSAIYDLGGPYWLGFTVRNLTDSTVKPAIHQVEEDGEFQSPWTPQAYQKVFGPYTLTDLVPWPPDTIKGTHCFEVLAYVRAGKKRPDVSTAASPIFVIYKELRP